MYVQVVNCVCVCALWLARGELFRCQTPTSCLHNWSKRLLIGRNEAAFVVFCAKEPKVSPCRCTEFELLWGWDEIPNKEESTFQPWVNQWELLGPTSDHRCLSLSSSVGRRKKRTCKKSSIKWRNSVLLNLKNQNRVISNCRRLIGKLKQPKRIIKT